MKRFMRAFLFGAAGIVLAGGMVAAGQDGSLQTYDDESYDLRDEVARERLTPIPVPIPTFFPRLRPDLVVTQVQVLGAPSVVGDTIRYRLQTTFKNQGNGAAGGFKISVDHNGESFSPSTFYVSPYAVPGQQSQYYPFVSAGLAVGASVTLTGVVTLRRANLAGRTGYFRVLVDSCSGEEFTPEYCRVRESLETNNTRDSVLLNYP